MAQPKQDEKDREKSPGAPGASPCRCFLRSPYCTIRLWTWVFSYRSLFFWPVRSQSFSACIWSGDGSRVVPKQVRSSRTDIACRSGGSRRQPSSSFFPPSLPCRYLPVGRCPGDDPFHGRHHVHPFVVPEERDPDDPRGAFRPLRSGRRS